MHRSIIVNGRFPLQQKNWVVVTDTVWSIETHILTSERVFAGPCTSLSPRHGRVMSTLLLVFPPSHLVTDTSQVPITSAEWMENGRWVNGTQWSKGRSLGGQEQHEIRNTGGWAQALFWCRRWTWLAGGKSSMSDWRDPLGLDWEKPWMPPSLSAETFKELS